MIITIDGIDGIGKGTQCQRLADYLTERGMSVKLLSFPQYSSFFGAMIGEYLNGVYGELNEINPKLTALVYAMDRKLYFENNRIDPFDVVIFDRYVPSNIAHQASKVDPSEREPFIRWLKELEYQVNKIPEPDLMVIFDAPVELAMKYVALKEKREYTDLSHDIHEKNVHYLTGVRELFLSLGKDEKCEVIRCDNGDTLLPVEQIEERVRALVDKQL